MLQKQYQSSLNRYASEGAVFFGWFVLDGLRLVLL